jgi:hypothetical protein
MKNIIKLLKQRDTDNIKDGYKSGHYGLEECVMELLDCLFDCEEARSVKNDAIVMYLHT